MSGHNKWAQIKHKKSLTDKKKGQLFSKLSKALTVAAKKGADPATNMTLAGVIEQARAANMPKDSIDRAIKKVSEKGADQLQEFLVEAIGSGGVALKIKGITDNTNRTIAELRKILTDNNAKMVQPGSTAWMFNMPVRLNESDNQALEKLLEQLDDHDDVDDVDTNQAE